MAINVCPNRNVIGHLFIQCCCYALSSWLHVLLSAIFMVWSSCFCHWVNDLFGRLTQTNWTIGWWCFLAVCLAADISNDNWVTLWIFQQRNAEAFAKLFNFNFLNYFHLNAYWIYVALHSTKLPLIERFCFFSPALMIWNANSSVEKVRQIFHHFCFTI